MMSAQDGQAAAEPALGLVGLGPGSAEGDDLRERSRRGASWRKRSGSTRGRGGVLADRCGARRASERPS